MGNKQEIDGNNNSQTIIENQNNYYSTIITEKDVRNISLTTAKAVVLEYFASSTELANKRINTLENMVINRFSELDSKFESFKDPAFVYTYRQAQIQAAMSDEDYSYNVLTELLAHRVNNDKDKIKKTGIQGAINIVNEVSEQSLTALTVLTSLLIGIHPVESNLEKGLEVLNELYGNIMKTGLPEDSEWQDQLDILKAIRIDALPFKKFGDYLMIYFKKSCFASIGIKSDSDQYETAVELLEESKVLKLIKNPYLDNYYVLNVVSCVDLDTMLEQKNCINDESLQKEQTIANKIISLYSNDSNLMKTVNTKFVQNWDKKDNLRKVHLWWDDIKKSCTLTSIGKTLGHAYAQICHKGFPPLD